MVAASRARGFVEIAPPQRRRVRRRADRRPRARPRRRQRRRASSTSSAVNSGAIASRSAAQPVTLRAIGPTWSKLGASGKAARGRDEVEGRLETDHAATRCRNADRPAGVGPERSFGEARCQRRSGTAGRAAGDPAGCEGIRDGAEVCVLRRDPVGELVQVRLADVRIAGRFGKEDGCCTLSRDVLHEDRRAVRRRQACSVEQILDREPRALAGSGGSRKEDAAGRHRPTLLATCGASASAASSPAPSRRGVWSWHPECRRPSSS